MLRTVKSLLRPPNARKSDHRMARRLRLKMHARMPTYLKQEMRFAMLGTILLVLLILMVIGAMPTWPHSRGWGYYPSGGIGLVLLILLILVLLGGVPIGL